MPGLDPTLFPFSRELVSGSRNSPGYPVPGLDPGIYVFKPESSLKTWMAGTRPAKGIFCGEKRMSLSELFARDPNRTVEGMIAVNVRPLDHDG